MIDQSDNVLEDMQLSIPSTGEENHLAPHIGVSTLLQEDHGVLVVGGDGPISSSSAFGDDLCTAGLHNSVLGSSLAANSKSPSTIEKGTLTVSVAMESDEEVHSPLVCDNVLYSNSMDRDNLNRLSIEVVPAGANMVLDEDATDTSVVQSDVTPTATLQEDMEVHQRDVLLEFQGLPRFMLQALSKKKWDTIKSF